MDEQKIYKEAAEKLWGLLDAMARVNKRHEILVSDGYSLHIPQKCTQKPKLCFLKRYLIAVHALLCMLIVLIILPMDLRSVWRISSVIQKI